MTSTEPPPATRTWREISQELKLPAMSSKGRRRAFAASARVALVISLIGLIAFVAITIYTSRRGDPRNAPVKTIALETDGILDLAWAEKTLAIPPRTALGELDLGQLKARLLTGGRVISASLTRKFPSTLQVTLAERFPVARLHTESDGDLLVGRDGVVFAGVDEIDRDAYTDLPWLAGIGLTRSATGFAPIEGMAAAADLLATARNEAPRIYRTWLSVDLSRRDSDGELAVQTKGGPRIVFGTNADYFVQIARLDYVLDHAPAPLASVDLSLGPSAVVQLQTPPPSHL